MQARRTIHKSSTSLEEAKRDLLVGESPATRANAARVLGAIGKHQVIAYLIAALSDSAAQVRRAAVEGLAEIGDSAAIEPLKALLLRETKNEVPETVIQHAIYSIAMLEARRRP